MQSLLKKDGTHLKEPTFMVGSTFLSKDLHALDPYQTYSIVAFWIDESPFPLFPSGSKGVVSRECVYGVSKFGMKVCATFQLFQ